MTQGAGFSFAPLDTKRHDRALFACGEPSLDRYLKAQATQDIRRGLAACFVAAAQDGRIAGYYTLSAYSVLAGDVPESLVRRMPAYPSIPAFLLGRLAIDAAFKGQGLGGALLADALTRACQSEIPGFAMIVDALNASAAAFYLHHGFLGFPSAPHRLFLPLASVPRD